MTASRLLTLSLAALLGTAAAAPVALAQVPSQEARRPAEDAELQAAIAKANAYTALANRTLRAIDSWNRYKSWVDMKRGPTGKERYIDYGMYSLYDVTGEIAKAEAATANPPAQPELDGSVRRYIKAYQELAPLVTRGERYYDRKDYRDDGAAEGRELHVRMVPAAEIFLRERAAFDQQLNAYKKMVDARDLAAIEAAEGRSARWQLRNIMINARAVMDTMPSNEKPIVDLKAFDEALAGYAAAIREMDRFKDANPSGVPMIESSAGSWLGSLRDFRDKLGRAKGDVRKGAASDANRLVSSYNMMISMSEGAARMIR
ncbi:YiiG family protein [Bosea sp. BK604]|uniref:YiiG family protein n=1 Tax=Bosea sp. BK604 TaxID=2512180 RepID=UPI00104C4230|nr:YiiG family protein [Bosea sp. BK604]TCR63372.1 uncharacterized protein DUF3829 [Bosea sp. BK604]